MVRQTAAVAARVNGKAVRYAPGKSPREDAYLPIDITLLFHCECPGCAAMRWPPPAARADPSKAQITVLYDAFGKSSAMQKIF